MGVAPEQYGAAVVAVTRLVVAVNDEVLKLLRVVPLDLDEVNNVLATLADVAPEVLILTVAVVIGTLVVVEVLELILELVTVERPGTLRVEAEIKPLEDDVRTTEERPGDEFDCGVPIAVLEVPTVGPTLRLVLGGEGCWLAVVEGFTT